MVFSLIANGQEFKKVVADLEVIPDVICIQETWLRPHLSCHVTALLDVTNEKQGRRCVTFIKDTLALKKS